MLLAKISICKDIKILNLRSLLEEQILSIYSSVLEEN